MAEDEGRQRLSTSGQTGSPTAGHHRFSGVRLNFTVACPATATATAPCNRLQIHEQRVRMVPSAPWELALAGLCVCGHAQGDGLAPNQTWASSPKNLVQTLRRTLERGG